MKSYRLRVGIQGVGSSTVDDMRILAELMAEDGIYLEALLEQDEWRRLDLLAEGRLDLVYESSFLPARFEGRRPEDTAGHRVALPIRVVASAHSGSYGFMVRGDSPIQTIYDIKSGTRVAVARGGLGDQVYSLLAWLQLNDGPIPEDPGQCRWKVDLVACNSWEDNLRAVPEKRADVAGVTPQNPFIVQAAKSIPGIRFLELPAEKDPEGARRFRTLTPQALIGHAPEEGAREIWGVSTLTGIANLWCLPDLDEELAWRLTGWFDRNYPRFKDRGNKLKTYSLGCLCQAVSSATAPIHPGTARYLSEKGLWSEANESRQRFNLWQEKAYLAAWKVARSRARDDQVAVSPDNPAWRKLWSEVSQFHHLLPHRPLSDTEIKQLMASRMDN